MIISPDFICIHLQKCGGSFLREFLTKNIPNARYNGIVHDRACDIPKEHENKPILGLIRNPWDWYVSWYAATQSNPKGLFWGLHTKGKKTTFHEFISKLFSIRQTIHNIDFGLIHQLGIGLYTYYYIKSYCRNPNVVFRNLITKPLDGSMVFEIEICRTENLRSDLMNFLATTHIGITESQANILLTMPKVNISLRNRYQDYYNEQLMQLIRKKDKYIVDQFGYEFE